MNVNINAIPYCCCSEQHNGKEGMLICNVFNYSITSNREIGKALKEGLVDKHQFIF
jgi:hypothetical protein